MCLCQVNTDILNLMHRRTGYINIFGLAALNRSMFRARANCDEPTINFDRLFYSALPSNSGAASLCVPRSGLDAAFLAAMKGRRPFLSRNRRVTRPTMTHTQYALYAMTEP